MLTQIHFLLTYTCIYQCDHCFLYSGPDAKGTFTINQLRKVYNEIPKIGTIDMVYFEGGESFLYYPLLLEGVKIGRDMDLKIGIVTNSYWATTVEDAELWLRPLCELGVSNISMSDDQFHFDGEGDSPAKLALAAAKKLGMPAGTICIEEPKVLHDKGQDQDKGEAIVGGGVVFRGRAVEKLIEGLPGKQCAKFTHCPYEDLENPKRVHVDSYGNVHLCQGLSMGNMWDIPLSILIENYTALSHPISGPLVKGGPALLAAEYGIEQDDEYIDECHYCYLTRRSLLNKFPQYLAPKQVYGLE